MEKTQSKNIQGSIDFGGVICVKADIVEPTYFMDRETEKKEYRLTVLVDEATKQYIDPLCLKAMDAKGYPTVKKVKSTSGDMVEMPCWSSPCLKGKEDGDKYIIYATSKFKPSSVWDLTHQPARKLVSPEEINAIQWVGGLVKFTFSIWAFRKSDGSYSTKLKFNQVCYAGAQPNSDFNGGACAFDSVSTEEPCQFETVK